MPSSYDRKTPITAADPLNDRVLPFFDSHEVKLMRVLIDRGSEYCGNPERREYEPYLAELRIVKFVRPNTPTHTGDWLAGY